MSGDECPLLRSMVHMQVKRAGEVEGSAIACRWYRDLMREGECSATVSGRWMLGIFQYLGFYSNRFRLRSSAIACWSSSGLSAVSAGLSNECTLLAMLERRVAGNEEP